MNQRLLTILSALPLVFNGLGGGLWNLIKALPTFIALGREILRFLHEVRDYRERVEKLKEFHAAVKTRDTAKINQLFGSGEVPPPSQPQP